MDWLAYLMRRETFTFFAGRGAVQDYIYMRVDLMAPIVSGDAGESGGDDSNGGQEAYVALPLRARVADTIFDDGW